MEESLNLVSSITKNAAHYIEIFSRAIDKVMPGETVDTTCLLPL
jgi:DNA replication licensing factor MCM7